MGFASNVGQVSLAGKKVTLVSDGGPADEHIMHALRASGADVVRMTSTRGKPLSNAESANIGDYIAYRERARPDAVVVYMPNMKYSGGKFEDDPTVQLASQLHGLNVPTLVVDIRDNWEFFLYERVKMERAGITYLHNNAITGTDIPKAVAQMIEAHVRSHP